ncbi:asparagine synthase (glutamine-hydrolyzing), partial [Methylocystis suflitae]|uniref:asparagine synthase (glutamine-hydrolyzing) n=1 Tax=Methylocystis suflitae TaxID=2951405 RepID=UPI00210CC2C4
MCGIAGLWFLRGQTDLDARCVARGMANAIYHRGPDAAGEWADPESGIALAHRRLSILDLSPAGAQPMEDSSGQLVIAFNGEIYNHLDLRRSLEEESAAPAWHGHSDTETLLAAIASWGVQRTLDRVCGMFAFALWDRSSRSLTLARDRLGEKPLYYGWSRGTLLFGSELEALSAYPLFDNAINREAIAAFLRFSYVPDPATIFQGIHKLRPGHFVRFDSASDVPKPQAYWSLEGAAIEGTRLRLKYDYPELCERVEACLKEVIASQMLSDVPLGCFLSGGIDSSLIAAIMQGSSQQRIRTFSIGFEDEHFNEAGHARRVAKHLGTDHMEFTVTEADALSVV